eukprot:TRINITY_DN442_c1_g1_i2.p1 TRINITY_DN442_c1_g1~~TRINITY_DN442_c1_g1_i2.p1  ORF type:complete len:402 (-),score=95.85 TRINITY_DN442_c1_g1_i2:941-1966(-)
MYHPQMMPYQQQQYQQQQTQMQQYQQQYQQQQQLQMQRQMQYQQLSPASFSRVTVENTIANSGPLQPLSQHALAAQNMTRYSPSELHRPTTQSQSSLLLQTQSPSQIHPSCQQPDGKQQTSSHEEKQQLQSMDPATTTRSRSSVLANMAPQTQSQSQSQSQTETETQSQIQSQTQTQTQTQSQTQTQTSTVAIAGGLAVASTCASELGNPASLVPSSVQRATIMSSAAAIDVMAMPGQSTLSNAGSIIHRPYLPYGQDAIYAMPNLPNQPTENLPERANEQITFVGSVASYQRQHGIDANTAQARPQDRSYTEMAFVTMKGFLVVFLAALTCRPCVEGDWH